MKVLIMYLRFPIFKLLPSSSPMLYLFHFKILFWCLFNVNLCHNNFAKLHHSHMTLDRFNFIKWEILLLPWNHLILRLEHKMIYNSLSTTPNSLIFLKKHNIYVLYICSKFQLYWWWSQRIITLKIIWLQN
jgi:hypothetical protein